jgi:hypothetical protein
LLLISQNETNPERKIETLKMGLIKFYVLGTSCAIKEDLNDKILMSWPLHESQQQGRSWNNS